MKPKHDEPRIKDYGLNDYVYTSKELPHSEGAAWKLVCQLPHNAQFQPWIELDGPAGETIQFDSSNPLVRFLTPSETCTTQAGVQTHEAANWVSGEGAIYTVPAGVTVRSVKYRETGYDTAFAGAFACNDEDYNTLWRKAARTCYVSMREHFFDCPDRERVGFWGDGTPELNQCFYVFDTRSHHLCKQLVLRELDPDFYPGQILEFLGEYGLWFYYLQTGDLESLRAVYAQTRTFLMETYTFGTKPWFDWGKETKDCAVMESCFYVIAVRTLKKIALLTGHSADVAAYDARLRDIEATFDAKYWRGDYYMSDDVTAPDDRANAMAVNAGLADSAKWESIYATVLSTTTHASCFFDRWVFEALCTMGKQAQALIRMHERYRTMIPCSFTTLWEHYDRWWASRIDAFDAGSSLNHGWNPPALLLSQTIAGVSPEAPGWSVYHVLPLEAFLTSIHVTVPSIQGPVTVDIQKTPSAYSLTLTSPPDTRAIVGIPKESFTELTSIEVNGSTIWNGSYCGGVDGITWHGEDARHIKFNAAPGQWGFVGRGALPIAPPKPPPPANDVVLDKRGWTASASVEDGSFQLRGATYDIDTGAANAIDGDHWTGWRDMTRPQYPGQWFKVDMKQPHTFDKIVLGNTWALWDFPDRYEVYVCDDDASWGVPIAVGAGTKGITTIPVPLQTARYIKIVQTGTSDYHWSIYEIDVSVGAGREST